MSHGPAAHETAPAPATRQRAARSLRRAAEAFYDRRYEEAVERCRETLLALLPRDHGARTPEEEAELFLRTYAAALPLQDAGRIAGVFTFLVRRREQFRHERGRPLPRRDWWDLLRIPREEAEEVLAAARLALERIAASSTERDA